MSVQTKKAESANEWRELIAALRKLRQGDFTVRLPADGHGTDREVATLFNEIVSLNERTASEFERLCRVVGKEGKFRHRAKIAEANGSWEAELRAVNAMVSQLNSFAGEVTRVAHEVGTEGRLGDETHGEIAGLAETINRMIHALKGQTLKNAEQDWLKTNLARFSRMLQGERDLTTIATLILSDLAPLVDAQYGAFYFATKNGEGPALDLMASYGADRREAMTSGLGSREGLIGQVAADKQPIRLSQDTGDPVRADSGLSTAKPANVIILPALFDGEVKAVIELGSAEELNDTHYAFLTQLMETVGIVLNTAAATMRTEALLKESRLLTQELQEKARLLENEKRQVEAKNFEIEMARRAGEEKAEQLALTSKYKSEFLREANLRGEAERLEVEKELQRTRLRQAAMLDTLPLALYEATLDERGRLVRRIIGGNVSKITGDDAAALAAGELHWEERIALEDSADLDNRCKGYTEATRAAHYRWNRSDGATIHILDQCVQASDGGWVGTLFDVTAQHELEQQLVQARKAEALGQLTGGVAHDFNNLLAAVLGGLRLLEGRVKLGEREKRIVQHMRHAAESGADLVRRLMAFARKQELTPTSVDPRVLCKAVAALAEHALGPNVSVRWRFPKSGPWLFVDKAQLELSLVNLLINARDAMPDGGRIDVAVEEVGRPAGSNAPDGADFLQIRVRDQGDGIPPRLIERVTEPFFTTKGAGEGTGLGLSMVVGFVEQSGGTLRIDSVPGEGTEIAMILPATRTPDRCVVEPDETEWEIRVSSVLLVDDDEGVREILGEQLRDLGLQVTVAENAEQAIEWLEQDGNCPEFVLTDFSMPGLDGMELLTALRRRWPAIKGAIMTGNPQDRLARRTISVPIVHKPIDLPDLKRLLAES